MKPGALFHLAVLPILNCALVSAAAGVTLRVPEDYSTINDAVDAANAGDSVLVGPGTWTGEDRVIEICTNVLNVHSVVFLKPGITVIGTSGPDATILDGGPLVTTSMITVLHASLDGPPSRLEGFTITGGGSGIALGCADTHVDIVDCRVVGNPNFAIELSNSSLSVHSSVVTGNGSGGDFEAVFAVLGGEFEAINTRFEGSPNRAFWLRELDRVLIDGCEFVDNQPNGAVTILDCPDVTIRGSLFLRNRTAASFGGAGALIARSPATIEFNTFAYDSAAGVVGGGALTVVNSPSTIRNNLFVGCSAFVGSGLAVNSSTATCANNIFTGCDGEAAALLGGSIRVPESGCNIFWDNTADYYQWPAEAMITDVHLDPQFCDPDFLDFTVRGSSPAAPENSGECGQVGAFGVGCGSVHVEATSWGHIKSLYRAPTKGR